MKGLEGWKGTEGRHGEISCAVTSSISLGKKVGRLEDEKVEKRKEERGKREELEGKRVRR